MINTKALRKQFQTLRTIQKNQAISGQWILASLIVLAFAIGAGLLALITRFICIGIMIINHQLIK